jgi:hypothetical protein
MIENEMGNRGSKSASILKKNNKFAVKEQRVYGSYLGKVTQVTKCSTKLRCTLMDFERNYQISNPSKQFILQTYFHTYSKNLVQESHLLLLRRSTNLNEILLPKSNVAKKDLHNFSPLSDNVNAIKPGSKLDP